MDSDGPEGAGGAGAAGLGGEGPAATAGGGAGSTGAARGGGAGGAGVGAAGVAGTGGAGSSGSGARATTGGAGGVGASGGGVTGAGGGVTGAGGGGGVGASGSLATLGGAGGRGAGAGRAAGGAGRAALRAGISGRTSGGPGSAGGSSTIRGARGGGGVCADSRASQARMPNPTTTWRATDAQSKRPRVGRRRRRQVRRIERRTLMRLAIIMPLPTDRPNVHRMEASPRSEPGQPACRAPSLTIPAHSLPFPVSENGHSGWCSAPQHRPVPRVPVFSMRASASTGREIFTAGSVSSSRANAAGAARLTSYCPSRERAASPGPRARKASRASQVRGTPGAARSRGAGGSRRASGRPRPSGADRAHGTEGQHRRDRPRRSSRPRWRRGGAYEGGGIKGILKECGLALAPSMVYVNGHSYVAHIGGRLRRPLRRSGGLGAGHRPSHAEYLLPGLIPSRSCAGGQPVGRPPAIAAPRRGPRPGTGR